MGEGRQVGGAGAATVAAEVAVAGSLQDRVEGWLSVPDQPVELDQQLDRYAAAVAAARAVRQLEGRVRLLVPAAGDAEARRWRDEIALLAPDLTADLTLLPTEGVTAARELGDSPLDVVVDDRTVPRPARLRTAPGVRVLTLTARAPAGSPSRTFPVPNDVERVGRWLAGRLAPTQRPPVVSENQRAAAEMLGLRAEEVETAGRLMTPLSATYVAAAVAAHHEAGRVGSLRGAGGSASPTSVALELTHGSRSLPVEFLAGFAAGVLDDRAVVVGASAAGERGTFVAVYGDAGTDVASVLTRVLDEGRRGANPYRGSVVEVRESPQDVAFTAVPRPVAPRSGLVLPPQTWDEIDRNVGTVFDRAGLLQRLGLGRNRGVLLSGPPGTGKTHACRVLAAELAGPVTVMFVTPPTGAWIARAYEHAGYLAPALLVIEDIDLGFGGRGGAGVHALLEAIDGLMTAHDGIVTLATTNHPEELDAAVRRAARFDRVIEFPAPPRGGREAILRRYLAALGEGFDVAAVAAATAGATGADLREVVRHAVLMTDGPVDTAALLDAARARDLYTLPDTAYL